MIPTTGRASLDAAVRSALEQTGVDVEVVVVADLDPLSAEYDGIRRRLPAEVRLLTTGGGAGGGVARNLGVRAATRPWVAFLDDDDRWDTGKAAVQLARAERLVAQGVVPVVSCRVRQVGASTGVVVARAVPGRTIGPGEKVADYLFRRRRPGARRASLFTSTLVAPTELARATPWREQLRRHQDWDWLLALEAHADVRVVHAPEELVEIAVGSAGSISAGANWVDSLAWADDVLRTDGKTYAEFLTAQTLRYALQARDRHGVAAVARRVASSRRLPSLRTALVGVAGALPRRHLETLMRHVR